MATKQELSKGRSHRNKKKPSKPFQKNHRKSLGPIKKLNKKKNAKKGSETSFIVKNNEEIDNSTITTTVKNNDKPNKTKVEKQQSIIISPSEHRKFFIDQFELANGVKLSSLELESINDTYFIKPTQGVSQDASNLGELVKDAFGSTWKELCEPQLIEGKIDAGNPAVLVISASAIRSLEMLRGLRILTKECQAVKLFSKHMKVDEQVAMLKKRVNIASGTPSRMKKLCEMEALGLSRLAVIVLDMHTDVKGYSLFTLPQVRDEFWDLYRSYFHQRLLQGNLRLCLYGPITGTTGRTIKTSEDQ